MSRDNFKRCKATVAYLIQVALPPTHKRLSQKAINQFIKPFRHIKFTQTFPAGMEVSDEIVSAIASKIFAFTRGEHISSLVFKEESEVDGSICLTFYFVM